ncbi:AAA domain-containing protein [Streptomyces luteogriseus]|uniref:AAA domain-containing protein n=1 Tax=Streptomyces luteogriseus TaxID=68233 RepID=UPI002E319CF9|nr:AAA domain-containing protein [Streptomyces luteogriseus]WTJ30874.1 AAA domain-containing protein [Streptomyces luteogriseus]
MAQESSRPYPVDELLAAVRLEVTAEMRSDGKDEQKVPLSNGRRISHSGAQHEYLFQCRKWQDGLDGKPLLVRPSRSTGNWAPAEAKRLPDGGVRLTTAVDLGESPTNVQVREDDAAGWRTLAERLEAVGQPEHPVRVESAGWMVGRGSPRLGSDRSMARWVTDWASLQLNSGQRQAVSQALASEVTFLWGPPGTGKTDVVGHIIEGSYRQDLTVLFLAPTKVAVDQALERVCDLLSAEAGFPDGLVQRAGDITVPSLRDRYGEQVDSDRIAARLSVTLDAALSERAADLRSAQVGIAAHDKVGAVRSDLATAQQQYTQSTQSRDAANSAQAGARREIAEQTALIEKIGAPRGLFADRKQKQLDDARMAVAGARARLESIASNLAAAERAGRHAMAEVTRLRSVLSAEQAKASGLPSRASLVSQADRLQQEINTLEEQRRAIKDTVRSKCRVLGATVAKAVQSHKLLDRVDVVVIDEAGMVDLPSAWYAAGLAGKRVVVAGDFRQLPAVTKGSGDRKATPEERDHALRWCARDVFHAAGLVGKSGSVRPDNRLVALNTQYRMRAPICDVVNTVAYPDAPLSTGRADGSRVPFNPLVDAPVILIDTSKQRIAGRDHLTNTVHEAAVHELVRGLQYEGVLPGRKAEDVPAGEQATDRLAVIAPYRAQVKALKNSLAYRFGTSYEGLVDTVHRFQGSQRPIVVLDTTAGSGRSPGYFFSGSGLSSHTRRLLNVALSRAQDHLVVLADVEHLREHLPVGSEALRMLDHLEANAQCMSVDQLIPVRDAAQLSALSDEELARPAFFPADEVPAAVQWDIARAARTIELYSPFLDRQPVRTWSAHLAKRVVDDVQVTVRTRDPQEQTTDAAAERVQELVDELRSVGCLVEFRERMHEKVLILDGSVLWHGSLNLLANKGPTDLMMRLTDPVACERVGRVIERARKERAAWNPRTAGAGKAGEAGRADGERLYLEVPYADKDEAKKRLGARWDPRRRKWYVDAAKVSREEAARWLPPSS